MQVSSHDLSSVSAAPRSLQWGWEREELGLTQLAGSFRGTGPARWLCVDNSAPAGAVALILQAWGRAFECAGLLAPGRVALTPTSSLPRA